MHRVARDSDIATVNLPYLGFREVEVGGAEGRYLGNVMRSQLLDRQPHLRTLVALQLPSQKPSVIE